MFDFILLFVQLTHFQLVTVYDKTGWNTMCWMVCKGWLPPFSLSMLLEK